MTSHVKVYTCTCIQYPTNEYLNDTIKAYAIESENVIRNAYHIIESRAIFRVHYSQQ